MDILTEGKINGNGHESANGGESFDERLVRLGFTEAQEIDACLAKDPVLYASYLSPEHTFGVEAEWVQRFADHPAVRGLPLAKRELLARTLAEKLDLPEAEIVRPAIVGKAPARDKKPRLQQTHHVGDGGADIAHGHADGRGDAGDRVTGADCVLHRKSSSSLRD